MLNSNETHSPFPLGTKFWMEICEEINKRGNYVWILLYDESGVCIGIQKLMERSQVKGFKKEYGSFTSSGAIGLYTEEGIKRETATGKHVERMDLSGTKKQY